MCCVHDIYFSNTRISHVTTTFTCMYVLNIIKIYTLYKLLLSRTYIFNMWMKTFALIYFFFYDTRYKYEEDIYTISAKNKSFSIYANIQSDFSGENHGEDLSSPGVSGGYWCCRRQDCALLDEGAREFHDLDEIFGIP